MISFYMEKSSHLLKKEGPAGRNYQNRIQAQHLTPESEEPSAILSFILWEAPE